MADPLAPFRKNPPQTKSGGAATPEPVGYVAFDGKDRVERLLIRRVGNPSRSPGYTWLLDIMHDDTGKGIVLAYTFMTVFVRGKNLQGLVSALQGGKVEYIQEFDPSRWEKPKDETTPFIESIEVKTPDNANAGAEQELLTRH